ncbi:MAG: class I SAM-dependent methyltransferase [Actinobacteria bacterium]|nr:class I SAM-dependent methyltransferase [Actinomycetota bacterium]
MAFWRTQVVPRMVEVGLSLKSTAEARTRVCAGLSGTVLEVGFGSGLNTTFYPSAVTEVLAVEPSDVAWQRAAQRVEACPVPVRRVGLDGQALPLPDDSVDCALSTWTLCTIPDVAQALAEVQRVLRPGGTLHFVEHGRAPSEGVEKWQHRFEPVQKRMAGGCHLARPIDELLVEAGYEIVTLDRYYAPKEPKAWAATYEGVSRPR